MWNRCVLLLGLALQFSTDRRASAEVSEDTCDKIVPASSMANIDFNLHDLQGPPSYALQTFASRFYNNTSAPVEYDTLYFDFCRAASGGGGNGDGSGPGSGTGSGTGTGSGSITTTIEEYCPDVSVYAYAINSVSHLCKPLGAAMSTTLFDTASPAKGVQVVYNGNPTDDPSVATLCPNGNSLTLSLRCSAVHVDLSAISATEYALCKYGVVWYTPYGCPTQCLSTGDTEDAPIELCGGHGLCGYDYEKESAVCTCDTGYSGDLCTDAVPVVESSGISGGLIFMIVLIVLLLIAGLGFIGYMYWRLYTVQTAKARAAYDNLKTNRDASGNIQIHV